MRTMMFRSLLPLLFCAALFCVAAIAGCDLVTDGDDPGDLVLKLSHTGEDPSNSTELGSFVLSRVEAAPNDSIFSEEFVLNEAQSISAELAVPDCTVVFWYVTDDGSNRVSLSGVQGGRYNSLSGFDTQDDHSGANQFAGTLNAFTVKGLGREPTSLAPNIHLKGESGRLIFRVDPRHHRIPAEFLHKMDESDLKSIGSVGEHDRLIVSIEGQREKGLDSHIFMWALALPFEALDVPLARWHRQKDTLWVGGAFSQSVGADGDHYANEFQLREKPQWLDFYLIAVEK